MELLADIKVTGPTKINRVSINYTKLYFSQFLRFCKLQKNAHFILHQW